MSIRAKVRVLNFFVKLIQDNVQNAYLQLTGNQLIVNF
jgi:hypothetical protein